MMERQKREGAPMLEDRERSNVFVVHADPIDARSEAVREGAPGSAASARKETPSSRAREHSENDAVTPY